MLWVGGGKSEAVPIIMSSSINFSLDLEFGVNIKEMWVQKQKKHNRTS